MAVPRRSALVALATVALAAAAAGCGSSGGTSGNSSPSAAAAASSATTAPGVAAAEQVVSSHLATPSGIGITTKVPGKIPAGKVIAFMDCGTPACHQLYEQFNVAAKFLHWTAKDVNSGDTPEAVTSAWNQLVANPPDGVVTSSQPDTEFKSQMAELAKKNIPVVDCCTSNSAHANLKVVSDGLNAVSVQAQLEAAWVVADSKGSGSAVWLATPAFPVLAAAQTQFQNYLKQYCSSCGFSALTINVTQIGTSALSTAIVGFLRAHPTYKYVAAGFDDEFIGLPAALSAAGLSSSVKLIGSDPGATELPYLKSGQESASVTFPAGSTMFLLADALARSFVGASVTPDDIVLPRQLVTGSTLTSTTVPPDIPNYQQQFEALWTPS
jgi:ABC-type sugar transport system substrate-binding protein